MRGSWARASITAGEYHRPHLTLRPVSGAEDDSEPLTSLRRPPKTLQQEAWVDASTDWPGP